MHYGLGNGLSAGHRRLDGWIAGLGDELVAVDVEGTTAYVGRDDVGGLLTGRPSETVRFLPGHDEWVRGPGTKDVHVTPPARREAVSRRAHPVVVGGVVRGTWARKGDDLEVAWLDERPPPGRAISTKRPGSPGSCAGT